MTTPTPPDLHVRTPGGASDVQDLPEVVIEDVDADVAPIHVRDDGGSGTWNAEVVPEASQTAHAFRNVGTALAAGGAGWEHVATMTILIVGHDEAEGAESSPASARSSAVACPRPRPPPSACAPSTNPDC